MTKRRLLCLLLTASTPLMVEACGSGDDSAATTQPADAAPAGPTVVASTAWTGALAKAAGAGKVTLIAPASVQHPSDYEPKPSDLTAVASADYVVFAQYDAFAKQLTDATGSKAKLRGLTPENSPAKVRSDVLALGKLFRTPQRAQAWIASFDRVYEQLSAKTKAKVAGTTAIAQVFNTPWASFAGLKLVGTYGPKPTTPSELLALKAKRARLLVENTNLPQGAAVESDEITKVSLLNYPTGLDLMEVFRKNAAALQAAVQ